MQNLWLTSFASVAFASIIIIYSDPSWIWFGGLAIIIYGFSDALLKIRAVGRNKDEA